MALKPKAMIHPHRATVYKNKVKLGHIINMNERP